ncbi:MAG: XRE family transcriptional regulator [Dissulfuribacterales bacterium]
MKNKHVGSNFDNFLQEEGLMAEAEATAIKRILAYQIKQEMELRHLSKTALAKMMKTSRSSVDRLLDPNNSSITLLTLENVAVALGKKLKLQFA